MMGGMMIDQQLLATASARAAKQTNLQPGVREGSLKHWVVFRDT